MPIEDVFERIKRTKFIAIIRGSYTNAEVNAIADSLVRESITALEITLNTSSALILIGKLRERFGEAILVGAGTVRTARQVQQAMDAGAQFLISPNYDPESVALAQQHHLLHLPGVATPTEAQSAFVSGCKMLKLYPADVLGG